MSGLGTQEVPYGYISQSLVSIIDKSKAYKSTLTLLGVVYIRVRHSVALNSGIKFVSSISMHLRLWKYPCLVISQSFLAKIGTPYRS